ncbi:hypothetical protein OBBRIDRAFT_891978 [Obba rivulosa]|uniref:DUF6534 domain-containing protein n=1 Tax=Obba rivulosa TaxID=1052685 RepID=A0A8E2DDU0_9APHY|nr:hypothetical protein OBBRIDRAFT_891978 [Obba rivulosa]
MASTVDRLALPALDNTMGAILIGVFIAAALWGVSCAQVYFYYISYRDPKRLQIIVLGSFLLDTLHQALVSHMIYTYLVTWYRDPTKLEVQIWSLIAQVLVSASNAIVVQGFFIWRVWILGGKRIVYVLPLALCAISEFGLSIAYFVKATSLHFLTETIDLQTLSLSVNAMALATDIPIAFALIMLLYKSKSGLQKTDNVIQRLIIFAMTTGMVTSLNARNMLRNTMPSTVTMRSYPFVAAGPNPSTVQPIEVDVTTDRNTTSDSTRVNDHTQHLESEYELAVFDHKEPCVV